MTKRLVLLLLLALLAIGGCGLPAPGSGRQRREPDRRGAGRRLDRCRRRASKSRGSRSLTWPARTLEVSRHRPLSAGPSCPEPVRRIFLERSWATWSSKPSRSSLGSIQIDGGTARVEGGFKLDYGRGRHRYDPLVPAPADSSGVRRRSLARHPVQVVEVDETILEPGKPKDPAGARRSWRSRGTGGTASPEHRMTPTRGTSPGNRRT